MRKPSIDAESKFFDARNFKTCAVV